MNLMTAVEVGGGTEKLKVRWGHIPSKGDSLSSGKQLLAGKTGKSQALEGVFSKGFCGLKAILGTLTVQAQSSDAG